MRESEKIRHTQMAEDFIILYCYDQDSIVSDSRIASMMLEMWGHLVANCYIIAALEKLVSYRQAVKLDDGRYDIFVRVSIA